MPRSYWEQLTEKLKKEAVEAYERGRRDENEACAKLADDWSVTVLQAAGDAQEIEMVANSIPSEIATAIRSRMEDNHG